MPFTILKYVTNRDMKLYLIRHGVSCSNLLRAVQGPDSLDADLYIDPELTEEGRRQAIKLRKKILKRIKGPFVVGASKLVRAQQTAYHLLRPSKLFIVPHISELMRESRECTATEPELQARLLIERIGDQGLPPIRDYSFFEDDTVQPENNQVATFLKWLALKGPAITGGKNLVLVSHSLFIDDFIRQTTGQESGGIYNYELIGMDVDFKNRKAVISNLQRIPYVSKKRLMWSTRKHMKIGKCRIPIRRRTNRK
jgi:broad specificity phosphatase PhoE